MVRKTPVKKRSQTSKKRSQPNKKSTPRTAARTVKTSRLPVWQRVLRLLKWPLVSSYTSLKAGRAAAPHKTFSRTRARDKRRKPQLENVGAFSWYVGRVLWARRGVYSRLLLLYVVLAFVMIGVMQINNIGSVNQLIDQANEGTDVVGPVMRAVVTVSSSLSGALNANLTDVQYLYLSALIIVVMLTIVWLVRQQLAGNNVTVRDGLYNAAAPLVAQYALVVVGVLQLLPLALGTLIYTSAVSGGLLDGGIETGMFSLALFLLAVLTLYFMTTTLFAMFISTIPGTYPFRAYRAARQIVAGQRLRLLLRLLWLALVILVVWFMVLIPVVIVTNSLSAGSSLVIPVAVQLVTGFSLIYATAYGYLLYRRMINEPVDKS